MPDRMKHKMIRTGRLQTRKTGNKKKTEIAATGAPAQSANAAASFPYPADFLTSSEGGSPRQTNPKNRQKARELLHYRQE